MKPEAPTPNAYIKTHNIHEPIRPVINNIPTTTYKLAKYLSNRIKRYVDLPNNT